MGFFFLQIGNALINDEDWAKGRYEYYWTHALVSDQTYQGIVQNCNYSSPDPTDACLNYEGEAEDDVFDIYPYDIYAPLCSSPPSTSPSV